MTVVRMSSPCLILSRWMSNFEKSLLVTFVRCGPLQAYPLPPLPLPPVALPLPPLPLPPVALPLSLPPPLLLLLGRVSFHTWRRPLGMATGCCWRRAEVSAVGGEVEETSSCISWETVVAML